MQAMADKIVGFALLVVFQIIAKTLTIAAFLTVLYIAVKLLKFMWFV